MEESCKVPCWHFPWHNNSTFSLWLQVPKSWPTRQPCGTFPALCRMLTRSWRCRPSRYMETWLPWPSWAAVWYFTCQLLSVSIWLCPSICIRNYVSRSQEEGIHERGHLVKIQIMTFNSVKNPFHVLFVLNVNVIKFFTHTACRYRYLIGCVRLCLCSYRIRSACSMPVQSKRRRAESAMRLRRWRDWKPKRGLKRWCHLHPTQVTSYPKGLKSNPNMQLTYNRNLRWR